MCRVTYAVSRDEHAEGVGVDCVGGNGHVWLREAWRGSSGYLCCT